MRAQPMKFTGTITYCNLLLSVSLVIFYWYVFTQMVVKKVSNKVHSVSCLILNYIRTHLPTCNVSREMIDCISQHQQCEEVYE